MPPPQLRFTNHVVATRLRVAQPLETVCTQGVEQPVPDCPVAFGGHQNGLVDQSRQRPQNFASAQPLVGAHALGGLQVEPPGEH
jgi:hypothetical protein